MGRERFYRSWKIVENQRFEENSIRCQNEDTNGFIRKIETYPIENPSTYIKLIASLNKNVCCFFLRKKTPDKIHLLYI